MNHIIAYGGYHATIGCDEDDKIYVGSVIGINDSISFHGHNIQEVEQHFKYNVDNYVEMCKKTEKQPEKEYHI